MGSVVISHVVGTTALILVLAVTGIYYNICYSSLQVEVVATQLEEVTDYVSSTAVDLVSMCSLSVADQLIVKDLKLPERLETFSYTVIIVRSSSTDQEELFKVRAYFDSSPSVFKESNLPWSTEGNLKIYNDTDPDTDPRSVDPNLQPAVCLSSFSTDIALWCMNHGGNVTIGLGVRG